MDDGCGCQLISRTDPANYHLFSPDIGLHLETEDQCLSDYGLGIRRSNHLTLILRPAIDLPIPMLTCVFVHYNTRTDIYGREFTAVSNYVYNITVTVYLTSY